MIFAVNADGYWSNDCQLLIVVLHVTPYSSCCKVRIGYCWVGPGATGMCMLNEDVAICRGST